MAIDKFDGKFAFLSNFYSCPVVYDGLLYQNAEAAFQSAKCERIEDRKAFQTLTPNLAKRKGRRVPLRDNWRDIRIRVMTDIVRDKFTRNVPLGKRLVATGDEELIEGNWWHDTYWGVDSETGNGENHLGHILMQIRKELAGK